MRAMLGSTRAHPGSEAIMENAISRPFFGSVRLRSRVNFGDDPLDPMRGVIFGSLMSLVLFWFPLAVVLTAR